MELKASVVIAVMIGMSLNTRRTAVFNYLEGRNASIDAKFSKLPNYHVARKKALQLLKIFLIKDCFDVLLN